MKKNEPISSIMTKELITLNLNDSLYSAEKRMKVNHMLSIRDLMIKNPLTASPKTTILEVSKLLASKEFHSLPVVDDGKLVGIITTTDLLHYFIELC